MPADYHRKQTIAGGERFITPALKAYEEKVLGADERILEREIEHLRCPARTGRGGGAASAGHGSRIGGARRARRRSPRPRPRNNYTKPLMHAGDELVAAEVRHPVVERYAADAFVPNDVTLDAADHQLSS